MKPQLALDLEAAAPVRPTPRLDRTTFVTSRMLDFAGVKELVAQTGHSVAEWPLVVLKELVDNAIDACEEAGVAPAITVRVDDVGISIADNGPGLPASTITSILDFGSRTSSREAYVSPTRGAQGNALKTIIAMPFALDGQRGVVEIVSRLERHCIEFSVDQIRQAPVIGHSVQPATRKNGTEATISWPDSASSILDESRARFLQITDDYAWLNPHLALSVDWHGDTLTRPATLPAWSKWKPSDPTSAHWYTPERLGRLVGAYLAHDAERGRTRTVRELVAEFRGLTGSTKQAAVLEATGLARALLSALIRDKAVDGSLCSALLAAMREHSRAVKPAMLGVIGRDHFAARFEEAGTEMDSFDYRKILDHDDAGIPFVVETAFGWLGEEAEDRRRMVTGVNWSPGIVNPFRQLGRFGQSLDSILERQRVGRGEPVILVLHVASARVEYLDRAKSSVVTS